MNSFDSKKVLAYVLMIGFWGSAFAGIRIGIKAFTPEHLSFLRLIVSSIALAIYAMFKKISLPDYKDIPIFILFGYLGFSIYQTALNIGEKTVSAGASSLLVSITPIFISIFSWLFLKEKQGKQMWIGSFIGLFGVVLISFGSEKQFSFGVGAWFFISSIF